MAISVRSLFVNKAYRLAMSCWFKKNNEGRKREQRQNAENSVRTERLKREANGYICMCVHMNEFHGLNSCPYHIHKRGRSGHMLWSLQSNLECSSSSVYSCSRDSSLSNEIPLSWAFWDMVIQHLLWAIWSHWIGCRYLRRALEWGMLWDLLGNAHILNQSDAIADLLLRPNSLSESYWLLKTPSTCFSHLADAAYKRIC